MKTTTVLLTVAVLCLPADAVVADDLTPEAEYGCASGCCQQHVEIVKETEYCWEVGNRQVCIPPVCCSWLEWLPFGKGDVRTVNILKRHEWECEKPVYKWVPIVEHCCEPSPPASATFSLPAPATLPQSRGLSPAVAGGPSQDSAGSLARWRDPCLQ